MKQQFITLILLAFMAIGIKAQTFIGMDDAWILASKPTSVCKSMQNKGLKMGEFTYGYYFYKDTQIKLANTKGKTTPEFLNPKQNALLSVVFVVNGYCAAVSNICKSKEVVKKWINELQRCGYKSTDTKTENDNKIWTYYNSTYKSTYTLTYFPTGEYVLFRKAN